MLKTPRRKILKKKKWLIIVATVNAVLLPMVVALGLGLYYDQAEIGRASCRERV